MLILKFDTTGITERIAEYEAKYGFIFPEQYRNFYSNITVLIRRI